MRAGKSLILFAALLPGCRETIPERTVRTFGNIEYAVQPDERNVQLSGEEDGMTQFIFQVSTTNQQSLEETLGKEDAVRELSFQMEKRFFLITAQDTIPCIFVHLEQRAKLGPRIIFHIAFETDGYNLDNARLLFTDDLWNNGPVYFPVKIMSAS